MADIFSQQVRSKIMASIRSKDTGPEKAIAALLKATGLKYICHPKTVPGSPDFVLKKHKLAILIHGCYWHVHGCPVSHIPKSRKSFWLNKFKRNIKRDARVYRSLKNDGWKTVVIWECALNGKHKIRIDTVAAKILSATKDKFYIRQIKGRLRITKRLKEKILNASTT